VLSSLALLLFAGALLSKPSVVAWPLGVLAVDVLLLHRNTRQSLSEIVPWLLAAMLVVALTQSAQTIRETVLRAYSSVWDRLLIAADSFVFYLRKVVLPIGLSPVYARTPKAVLASWMPIAELAGLIVAIILLVRIRDKIWLAAAAVFLAALLPVLGLVHFGYQVYSTVADRYVYAAMLGPAMAVSAAVQLLGHRTPQRVTAVVCGLFVFGTLLGSLAFRQVGFWHNDETLWRRAVAAQPGSALAHANLAAHLGTSGHYDEAVREVDSAIALDADSAIAHYNRGVLLSLKQDWPNAQVALQKAVRLEPSYAEAHYVLGSCLGLSGQISSAITEYKKALQLKPDMLRAHLDLAAAYFQAGRPANCEAELRIALRIAPASGEAHKQLGILRAAQGLHAEAAAEFRTALSLLPGDTEIAGLLASVTP
jgi:tetratricopeptide (TPR) repeat protein